MPGDKNSQQKAQTHASKSQPAQSDAFVKHLEHASAVVQSWPAWKQQLLGGDSIKSPKPTPPGRSG